MVEYLEPRQMLASPAIDPTISPEDFGVVDLNVDMGAWQATRFDGTSFVPETLTTWNAPEAQTVVVSGDLWGSGQNELVHFDPATGSFVGEWQSGSGIATGVIVTWVPQMDLQFLTLRDLNQDGRDDIIAMDRRTGQWAASTTRSDGTYDTRFIGTWQAAVDWQNVMFADLNGDNYDDLFGYNPNTSTWSALFGTSSVFLESSFSDPLPSGNPSAVVIANFDGVAGAEIFERDAISGDWVATSFADGRFQSRTVTNWASSGTWTNVRAINFWGNGRQAVIGLNTQTNEWRLTWSAGSGVSSSTVSLWGAGTYDDVQIGDINGDGREDLLARQVATGRWYALSSTSSSVQTKLLGTWQPNATYTVLRAGNFNPDSQTDLVGLEVGTGVWRGLLSASNGSYNTVALNDPSYGLKPTNIGVGDINADGRLDIISQDQGTDNWQLVSVNNGVLTAQPFNAWTAYGTGWNDRYVLNFDGQGDNDLLARDTSTGDWWLTTFIGTEPTTRKVANWSMSIDWSNWLTIDFDNNGTMDVLARDTSTGNWHYLRSANGVVTSTVIANWSTATNWVDFQVADLFGTGRPLVIARDAVTNNWQGLWSIGSGFSSNPLKGLAAGRTYVDTQVVDFFGDGRQTVVTRDASSGLWYGLWYQSGQFQLTYLGGWSTLGNWTGVTVADLDGTGRDAIYGFHSVTGTWNRIDFDGVTATQTAVARDLTMQSLGLTAVGHFVDATRDAIVARSTFNQRWYRLTRDAGGYLLYDLGVWSESSDWTSTTIADFNRDGRADTAGYSASQSKWAARTLTGNTSSVIHLGSGNATSQATDVPGASDATLKAIILADTPGLSAAAAAADTRTMARLLRNWAANAVDSALFSNPLLTEARSASEAYFSGYALNKAGSSCGGVAEFYVVILRLFGIDSLTVGLGDPRADEMIHTTVVVPIRNGPSWSFEIFDPTFNCTFVDALTGNHLSYTTIVSAVKSGNTANVTVEEAATLYRDFLSRVAFDSPDLTLLGIQDGIYVYRWPNYGLDDYVRVNQSTFTRFGYASGNAGYYQLMAKVLVVNPNNGSGNPAMSQNQRTEFLAELAQLGVIVPN